MKAHFHREGLLAAVQIASVAVAAKDVKPILKNLKAIAQTDHCTLMATDLELGIRLEVRGVKVDEAGEAILPASRTLAILRESADEELLLEASTERCRVQGQYNEFEMPSDDPVNFPDVPAFAEEKFHELKAETLREMIRRTIFAAAVENPRYAVTGILWELEGDLARLVATDGRRLAVDQGPAKGHGGHDTKGQTPVVPTKAMALLERNLTDPNESVRVSLRPNEVLFKTDRAMIYSRLVEGRYPAYREVFPKKTTTKFPLSVGPFLSAIRQAAIMTDEESKKVTFTFSKKKLTLQASGAETGRSKVEMPLEYDGKAFEIRFDPHYLTDMLRILDPGTSLTLELVDGNSPALFRIGDYSYVVMPLT
ncbi:MAG TPA: DNA polymerase III subunit beta [Gemmataceae bacterium]|jgi:DNA polymerase-3 subunit beta|nr:DNA polymerase III subunit beta [Gemmataceae bacterium]